MKKINKTVKAIIILLISATMLFAFTSTNYAESENELAPMQIEEDGETVVAVQQDEVEQDKPVAVVAASGMRQILDAGRGFINKGNAQGKDAEYFANELAPIGSILTGIGIIIFFVVLIIIGMKWAVAKPEDKAKLKQALIGYVIAAIVFFGAVGIWNLARTIMENIEGTL